MVEEEKHYLYPVCGSWWKGSSYFSTSGGGRNNKEQYFFLVTGRWREGGRKTF